MTKQQKTKLSNFWVEGSVRDLKAAKSLIALKMYPNGLFFLHLSLEKALKSLYVQKFGRHAPFSHNLVYLMEACELEMKDELKSVLSVINEFNISTRYPDEQERIKKKFNKRFSEKYLKLGKVIQKWIITN